MKEDAKNWFYTGIYVGALGGIAFILFLWLFASFVNNRTSLYYAQAHYCVPITDKIMEDAR